MENDNDKKNDKYRKLNVFYEPFFSLKNIALEQQKLHSLIIIGQPEITCVKAISELKYLKELWIVECRLKDVTALKRNTKLKKLYLYANEIERIPDFSKSTNLKIISLARNKINDIRNIGKISGLQDLNVADNCIKRVPNIFSATSQLQHINFSGNPLSNYQDVENLYILKNLQKIEFSDPVYGECPLVSYNFRSHLIHRMPNLREIDCYPVGLEERNDLSKNELSSYNKIWFKCLSNGSLDSNIFTKIIHSDEFINIKQLTLCDCKILQIDLKNVDLPHLESLDLSKNNISSLWGLLSLENLQNLCMSNNDLGKPKETEKSSSILSNLQEFSNLVAFYANDNKMTSLVHSNLPKMPSLEYLFLQHNRLKNIEGLEELKNLDTLILDHNKIEIIDQQSLSKNPKLKILFLENNKLTSLNFTNNLQKIEKLFVANNKIADINELKSLLTLKYLKEITIEGNPFCHSKLY